MRSYSARAMQHILLAGALLLALFHVSAPPPARGGEAIRIGGPGDGTVGQPGSGVGTPGAYITWNPANFPITYTVDGGNLGSPAVVPTPISTMVDSVFGIWAAVPTASLSFNNAGGITPASSGNCVLDGDVSDITEYGCLATASFPGSPIIFDVDGSIIDQLNGAGASNSILGFAGPITSNTGFHIRGFAVLNGKWVDGITNPPPVLMSDPPENPETSVDNTRATALHEYGHLLGLGHSQINLNCLTSPFVAPCNSGGDDAFGLPTMFPVSITNLFEGGATPPELTLSLDDIAWISRLYPNASFSTTHGTISGTLFTSDGLGPIQGGNMIARQADDPATAGINESRRCAVSVVSGERFSIFPGQIVTTDSPPSNRGSTDPTLYGTYSIPVPVTPMGGPAACAAAATAGTYTIEVEGIHGTGPNAFVLGSSVGPHGRVLGVIIPIPGPAEFFSGAGETGSDSGTDVATPVSVTAGIDTPNINIRLDGTPSSSDAFEGGSRNDTVGTAAPIGNGTRTATISPMLPTGPDRDVYSFTALAGQIVTLDINAEVTYGSFLDPVIEVLNSGGTRVNLCRAVPGSGLFNQPCMNDDDPASGTTDSRLEFQSGAGGTFFVHVLDWRGDARVEFRYDLVVSGAGQAPPPAGCTFDFDNGAANSDWNTAANWNPDGLPSAASDVCIGAAFNVTYPSGATTINSLANVAGTLNVAGGTLSVTSSIAIGGTLTSSGTGILNAPASNMANLAMNGGTVNFNGPSASVLGLTFTNGTLNAVGGTVTLPAAGYTHAGGFLRLVGGSVTTAGTITQTGGLIEGTGTLTANIIQNVGTLGAGLSPGVLNVTGNMTQNPGGTIVFEIGGTTAGTQHDRINFTGNVVQDGTVNIVYFPPLSAGTPPNLGDTFTLATFASGGGTTGTTNFPPLPAGQAFVDIGGNSDFTIQVQLASKDFDGNTDGDGDGTSWNDPLNWIGDSLPAPGDNVRIGVGAGLLAGPFTVTKNGATGDTINSLTIANGQGVFTLGSQLNISAASVIGDGRFIHTSGVLAISADLDINGPFTWTGGTHTAPGATNLNGGATIGGAVTVDGRTFNNSGVLVWGAGNISLTNAIFNNAAASVFTIQTDTTLNATGTAAFNNSGTVNKTAGGGATTIAALFNNSGLVSVNAGTLDFTGGGTCGGVCGGNWTVAGGAFLGFAGGTFINGGALSGAGEVQVVGGTAVVTFNGAYAITGSTNIDGGTATFAPSSTVTSVGATLSVPGGSVDFSSGEVIAPGVLNIGGGLLTGSDTVNVSGLFSWSGGSLQGTNNAVLNANGGMNITGAGQSIVGRRVTNNAAAVMTGSNMAIGSQPASLGGFINAAAGTFDLQSAATFAGTGVVPQAFTNNGTFIKAAGGTATFGVEFHSTGTLNANSGTLLFNNVTNSFNAPGLVRLNGGGLAFQGGAGTMTISGGTLAGVGTITGNVNIVGGNVTPGLSPGILNIAGNYTQGPGGTLTAELGGVTQGTQYDLLAITGSATLAGILNVDPFAAFVPTGNFQIITAGGGVGGDFATKNNNTAGANFAATPGANDYIVSFVAATSANLSVTKADAPDPVNSGANLTYTITVSNAGPDPATSAVLNDTLPATLGFVSITPPAGWTCGAIPAVGASGLISCTNPSVANGANDVFTLVVTPRAAAVPSVSNTATVSSADSDPVPANNSATATTTVNGPDLTLTKTDSGATFRSGFNSTYSIGVTNAGPGTATETITVSDTLVAGLSFVSATGTGWTCNAAGQVVTCTHAGPLASGNSLPNITLTVVAAATLVPSVSNTATVATAGDTVPANDSSSVTTTVEGPDLRIIKFTTGPSFTVGVNATYEFIVDNVGTGVATELTTVSDTLPAGLTFVSANSPGWTCNAVGQVITCTRPGPISPPGLPGSTIIVTVAVGLAARPTVANTATISTTGDANAANDSSTVNTPVLLNDLSITKVAAAPGFFVTTAQGTYNTTVTNNGDFVSGPITVTDTLPAGLTFVSGSGMGFTCNAVGQVVTCNHAGGLAIGAQFNFTIDVNVLPAAFPSVNNTATVSMPGDGDPSNDSGSTTTTVRGPDLSLVKTDSNVSFTVGTQGTYTFTVTNNGNAATGNITVTDTLPAGLTFVSGSGMGFTCSAVGQAVTCDFIGSLGAGLQLIFTVDVNVGAAAAPSVTNTATASTAGDTNPANDSGSDTTSVIGSADISVTKADSADPVNVGQNITYTVTVTNGGPNGANNVTVADALPANVTFVSATPSQGTCNAPVAGVLTCNVGAIANGANASVAIVVTPQLAAAGTTLTNTVSATTSDNDPNAANNTNITETTAVNNAADLAVTKTDAPDPVTQGQDVTYTITVTNNGPQAASSVALNDAVPAGTTFVSLVSPGGWTCSAPAVGGTGNVNCTNPTLANGASAVFTLVVNTAGAGASVNNTATVAAAEVDPVPANNSATATTAVNVVADLAVTKTDAPDPIVLGAGNITYTVMVSNNGPNNAPTVTLTDTVPVGVTFVSATPSQGACPAPVAGVLTCNLGTINSTFNATVVIIVTPTVTGVLTNTVSATSGATDPNGADNTNIVATTTVNALADLAVTKVDTVDPVLAGTNITYQLSVTNNGPSPATNVILTDNVPGNITFVSVGAPCTPAAGVVTCNFGTLASGATTAVVNLVLATNAASVPTVTNTATVTATEPDPVAANNSATQNTTVNPAVDLAVTKTDAPDPVNVNATLTYTVTVTNNGPSNATGVTLTDTLPANATFGVATPSQGTCAQAAGVVTCNLGTINSAASATVTITVTPTAAAGGTTITNTASATATQPDTNAANNTGITATTAVNAIADVSITKTDAPDPVNAGANLTYTITVSNAGPSPAAAVTVTDALPAGLTLVTATPSVGTCAGVATVTCNLGALASGANATVAIVATITGAAPASVSNTATVASTTSDPNAANNSATTTTAVTPIADIQVTITDAPDPVTVNSSITYTVTVRNNGPSAAANVTATTALPANTTFVSATASAGACVNAAGTITCNLGTLASGASVTATVIVTATASGTVNASVTVATTTTDPIPANNTATTTTTVTTVVTATDFGLTVTPTSQFVIAGQGTSFSATATPSLAGAVFGAAVTFSCIAQQHGGVACAMAPATVAAGATVANSTVSITTTAPATTVPFRMPSGPGSWPLFWFLALSMTLAGVGFAGRKLAAQAAAQRRWGYCYSLGLALLMISMAMSQSACVNGPTAGEAPRGPVGVTVTATSGSVSRSTIVFVVVQ